MVPTTTYTYDNNGNTVSKSINGVTTTYSYNNFNQQISVTSDGKTAQYAYNTQGIRTVKAVDGSVTKFYLDGGNVVGETTGTQTVSYLRGLNLIHNGSSYYLFNAHADVVNLTNSSGSVTKTYSYDAFGVEKNPSKTDTNHFRYCGEYWDAETETYYLRARYYDPALGRFTQQDTRDSIRCEDPLSLNLYIYCENNPIFYIDPKGTTIVAVRSMIEGLGGSVYWDNRNKTATIALDGKFLKLYDGDTNGSYIEKGKLYTDDSWIIYALSYTFDLGNGWKGRIERSGADHDYQKHVHVYKNEKHWSQNEDGSPHDKNNNSSGNPPEKVLKILYKNQKWDWNQKKKDYNSKQNTVMDPLNSLPIKVGAPYILPSFPVLPYFQAFNSFPIGIPVS